MSALSLHDIQVEYFDLLDRHYGEPYRAMKKAGLGAMDAAGRFTGELGNWNLRFIRMAKAFNEEVWDFWGRNATTTRAALSALGAGRNGFYAHVRFQSSIASRAGIYLDTIALPDPFLRSERAMEQWMPYERAFHIGRAALHLMDYRELACADISPPIIVVVPGFAESDTQAKAACRALGRADSLKHAQRVFGRDFASFDDMFEYAKTLDTVEKVVSNVKEPKRLVYKSAWTEPFAEQVAKSTTTGYARLLKSTNPGYIAAEEILGTMSFCNETLLEAEHMHGTPLIDSAKEWQYLLWKLELDALEMEESLGEKNLHVVRGLQDLASTDMQWLGQVPHDALLEVRKSGAIHEMRDILGSGVQTLVDVSPSNFHRTRDQVFGNIHSAFDRHKRAVRELSNKKWRFAGTEVGSWLALGSIELTAAITGGVGVGVASVFAHQVTDMPKPKDIIKSAKALISESKRVSGSAVALLFKIKEKSGG